MLRILLVGVSMLYLEGEMRGKRGESYLCELSRCDLSL